MTDHDYKFASLSPGPASHAARRAVLHPLMDVAAYLSPSQLVSHSIATGNALIDRWRARVEDLRQAGWHALASQTDYERARNCWPGEMLGLDPEIASQRGGKAARLCRLTHSCPWCWGRWVEKVYDGAVRARGPHQDGHATRVASMVGDELLHFGVDLRQWLAFRVRVMRTLAAANELVGGCVLVTAWPVGDHPQGEGWLLSSRLLAVIPAGRPLRAWPPTRSIPPSGAVQPADWVLHGSREGEEPTDAALAGHVARVCRYPAALMNADPGRVAEYINARSRLRLSERLGAFRVLVEAVA